MKREKVSAIEVTGDAKTLFNVSEENWLQKAVITSVKVNKTDKNEDQLTISFESFDGKEAFDHNEKPIVKAGQKASIEDMMRYQLNRLVHIYNCFAGKGAHTAIKIGDNVAPLGEHIIDGVEQDTWESFFKAVATAFNEAAAGTPIYKKDEKPRRVWLKITRNTNGYLQLPFPNFIEPYHEGQKSYLQKGYGDIFDAPKKEAQGNAPTFNKSMPPAANTDSGVNEEW